MGLENPKSWQLLKWFVFISKPFKKEESRGKT